jgi:polysaccharide deacetylase family protein (PEP-CTERM system associated)
VVLEDYYHVAPLKSVVHAEQWYRFERRFALNTQKALDLLDEFQISATFFVLGSIADEMPALVREVVDRGHEVASKGYFHHSLRHFSREGFREDLQRSREALEKASGRPVLGFRIGHRWFGPDDLWALDILAEEGFSYDSSVRPLFRKFSEDPWRRKPHKHIHGNHEIWEFPLTSWNLGGLLLPISGGNYFRQLPHCAVRRAVKSWVGRANAPFLMYFHVWELDPDQPRIRAAPWTQRIRQYRNLERMEPIVRYYLERYSFVGIADYLGLRRDDGITPVERQLADEESGVHFESPRTPISVVVPCFNEELILPYLSNTLKSVEQKLGGKYDFKFIFVDDGSVDETWSALKEGFDGSANCSIVRHAGNRGVAAAILTGIRNAETDIVCSIDCDCTYDPHQLQALIPMLTDGVDMVTASPYHKDGAVRNVPEWRLFLSKSLSSLYRFVLHHQLATYTSCFRVYRRQTVKDLNLNDGGFLGVAEMLGQLDLEGRSIVECPATLEVRLLGRSKMKTLKTIAGHLALLVRLAAIRAGIIKTTLPSATKTVPVNPVQDSDSPRDDIEVTKQ